jgi:outer membrane protein
MKKSVLTALCLASVNVSAAMILGFGAEVDYYHPTASGDFNYKNTVTHFSNDSESAYQVGVYLEHPVPFVPNLRIDYTPDTSFSGTGNKVTFNQLDVTPYYEILDNVVDVDLGISFKVLDGKVAGAVDESFNQVIPMGYLGAAAMIPGIPLSVAASVKYIGFNGDALSDARVKAVWKIAAGLQAQAGYRQESLRINDRFDMNTNMTIKGPFVGLGYTF